MSKKEFVKSVDGYHRISEISFFCIEKYYNASKWCIYAHKPGYVNGLLIGKDFENESEASEYLDNFMKDF